MSTELASTEQPDGPTPDNSVASNHADSQLFLVRLWLDEDTQQAEGEPGSEAAIRWRGRVQHLLHGETSLFIGWDMLVACLQAMLLSHPPHTGTSKSETTNAGDTINQSQ